MTVSDSRYWEAQVEAAIGELPVEASVRSREDAREIVVENDHWGREHRAEVIHALEAMGFVINSTTKEREIRVDVTPDRLIHDFAEVTAA